MKQNNVESDYQFRNRVYSSYNPQNQPSPVSKRRKKRIGKGRGRPPKNLKIMIPIDSDQKIPESMISQTNQSITLPSSPTNKQQTISCGSMTVPLDTSQGIDLNCEFDLFKSLLEDSSQAFWF